MNNRFLFVILFTSIFLITPLLSIPQTVNYQGKLYTDIGGPIEGTRAFGYRMYVDNDDDGWEDTDGIAWEQIPVNLAVSYGLFTDELDFNAGYQGVYDFNSLFDNAHDIYLRVYVGPAGSYSDFSGTSALDPPEKFRSTAYAFYASNIVGGEGQYVQFHPASAQNTGNVSTSLIWLNENGTGTPNLLELEQGGSDQFTVGNTGDVHITGDLTVSGADITIGTQLLDVSDGDAPNIGSNLAHWDNLTGVPAGFADGSDNTGAASLQEAYEGGNTITTDAGNGEVYITGGVSAADAMQVDAQGTAANTYGIHINNGWAGLYAEGGERGVYGTGSTYGVYGIRSNNFGYLGGSTHGVYGEVQAASETAVYGLNNNTTTAGATAVEGRIGNTSGTGGKLGYIGTVAGTDKQIGVWGNATAGNYAGVFDGEVILRNHNEFQLREASANGNDYVAFVSKSDLSSSATYTWPELPAGDRLLQSDNAGNLSWVASADNDWTDFVQDANGWYTELATGTGNTIKVYNGDAGTSDNTKANTVGGVATRRKTPSGSFSSITGEVANTDILNGSASATGTGYKLHSYRGVGGAGGGGGDNWGTQDVVSDATLSGNGDDVALSVSWGSVTQHTDVTSAGSGAIITIAERANLHAPGSDNQNLINRVQDDGGASIYTVSSQMDILEFADGSNTTANVSQSGNTITVSYDATGVDAYDHWNLQANALSATQISSDETVNFEEGTGISVGRTGNTINIAANQNTQAQDGYVSAGGSSFDKVWKTDGSGVPGWRDDAGAGGDNDWIFNLSDGNDTTLVTGGRWGISRAGVTRYGNADSTHVNLGVAGVTGTSGQNNKYATVSGGLGNTAASTYSTVSGGSGNTSSSTYATVGGGSDNTASGYGSTVAGGDDNVASGDWSFLGGGDENYAIGSHAALVAGQHDTADGSHSFVGAGYMNRASGSQTFVGSGWDNEASGQNAVVVGGTDNYASAQNTFIGGGIEDSVLDRFSSVVGGMHNVIDAERSFIGGGEDNYISGNNCAIGGGEGNSANDFHNAIAGGYGNYTSGQGAAVGGGWYNTANAYAATVSGGYGNSVTGSYSIAPGGRVDTISGDYSFAFGYGVKVTTDNTAVFYDGSVFGTGSVGINIESPLEALDVGGAIRIGNTTNTNNGAIRWNGSNFQGYKGGWVNLDAAGTDDQNLSFTGASSPYTLDIEGGTDVTFAQGAGITLSRSVNELTITNSGDLSTSNEYNTSMGWDDGTNTVSVTDGGGAKSVVITGFADASHTHTVGDHASSDLTGCGNVDGTWNMQIKNGVVGSAEITDASVAETDLDINNAPTENYVLSWNNTAGKMEWQVDEGGGSVSGSGTVNYVAKFTPTGSEVGNSQIIDDGTNIGIATATPDEKLDVSSDGNTGLIVQTTATSSYDAWVRIRGARTTSTTGDISHIRFENNESGGAFEGARISMMNSDGTSGTSNADLLFYTNNGTALTEQMRLLDNGNVGIGTTNPQANLSVGGDGVANIAVYGRYDANNYGYLGDGGQSRGVYGTGTLIGVAGISTTGKGLSGSGGIGMWCEGKTDGYGVFANPVSGALSDFAAVYASATYVGPTPGTVTGVWAGYFDGDVNIDGDLTVSGSFPGSSQWTQTGSDLYPNNTSWNVGIGTTSPTQKLDVNGDIKSTGYGIFPSGIAPATSGAPDGKIFSPSGAYLGDTWGIKYNEGSPDYIEFWGNSMVTSRIALDNGNAHFALNGGDVGIGTNSPSAKLHVEGGQVKAINGTVQGYLAVSTTFDAGVYGWTSDGSAQAIRANNTGTNGYAIYATGDRNYFEGDVGIGTASPSYLLDVNGEAYFTGSIHQNLNGARVEFEGDGSDRDAMYWNQSGTTIWKNFIMTTGDLKYEDAEGGNNIYFLPGGNVGIGTSNPLSKLSVGADGSASYTGYFENTSTAAGGAIYGIKAIPTGTTTGSGVYGKCLTGGSGYQNGVYGYAYDGTPTTGGRRRGVYGHAGNGDVNSGVCGILRGDNDGAGVFGADASGNDASLDGTGQWAGFFDGDVNITGDLTVSGSSPGSSQWTQTGSDLYPNNTDWQVGIGNTSPSAKLELYDGNESITQDNFTQAVTYAGLLISTDYTPDAYTPGVFWQTANNNETKPKAGIYMKETASGTHMYFGTSNNYGYGITNDAIVIDNSGDVGIGNTSPSYPLHVTGKTYATGNIQSETSLICGSSDAAPVSRYSTTPDYANDLFCAGQMIQNGTGGLECYKVNAGGTLAANEGDGYFAGYVGVGTTPSSTYRIYATGASYGIRAHGSTMGGRFEDTGATSRTYVAYGNYGIYQNLGTMNYFLGDVGIGTTSPSAKLHVNGTGLYEGNVTIQKADPCLVLDESGDGGTMYTIASCNNQIEIWPQTGWADKFLLLKEASTDNGLIYFNQASSAGIRSNSGTMQYKHSSGSWTDIGGGGGVTGSGTANYIPKWTGGTTLGNSDMTNSSNNVNFGNDLRITLDNDSGAQGMPWMRSGGGNSYLIINSSYTSATNCYGIMLNWDNNNDVSLCQGGGEVMIGSSAEPAYKLDVNGNGRFSSTGNPGLVVGNGSTGYLKIGSTGWYDDGSYFSPLGNRHFYIRSNVPTSYIYSANIYLGYTSGTTTHLRGNAFDWTSGGGGIINTSGRVGIGTTSPGSVKLRVIESGTAGSPIYANMSATTSTYAAVEGYNPNTGGGVGVLGTGYYGVYGEWTTTSGWAGYFEGDAYVDDDMYVYDICYAYDFYYWDTYDDIALLNSIEGDTVWDEKLGHYKIKAKMDKLPKCITNYDDDNKSGIGDRPWLNINSLLGLTVGAMRQLDGETKNRDERLTARTDILAGAIGIDFSNSQSNKITRKLIDFGSANISDNTVWVPFNEDFASQLPAGSVPIVTITSNCPTTVLCVIEKDRTGFKVTSTTAGKSVSFDWSAFARVEVDIESDAVEHIDEVFHRESFEIPKGKYPTDNPDRDRETTKANMQKSIGSVGNSQ